MQFVKAQRFEKQYELSEAIHEGFMMLFADRNPLHTDKGFAQKLGFAEEVMHGNILGGFLSHFIGECLPEKKLIIHRQEMQFKKPVYRNDLLTLVAEVEDFFESVKAVTFTFSFVRQNADIVAKGTFQIGLLS